MIDLTKCRLRSAFVETGILLAGGIAGGGLSAWLLGDNWLVTGLFAVLGAWLASIGARRIAGIRSMLEG